MWSAPPSRVHCPAWVPAWGLMFTCNVALYQGTARQAVLFLDGTRNPRTRKVGSLPETAQVPAGRAQLGAARFKPHLPLSIRILSLSCSKPFGRGSGAEPESGCFWSPGLQPPASSDPCSPLHSDLGCCFWKAGWFRIHSFPHNLHPPPPRGFLRLTE